MNQLSQQGGVGTMGGAPIVSTGGSVLRAQLMDGTGGPNGQLRPQVMASTIRSPLNQGQLNPNLGGPNVNTMQGPTSNPNISSIGGQDQTPTSMLLQQLGNPPSSDPNPSVINSVSTYV